MKANASAKRCVRAEADLSKARPRQRTVQDAQFNFVCVREALALQMLAVLRGKRHELANKPALFAAPGVRPTMAVERLPETRPAGLGCGRPITRGARILFDARRSNSEVAARTSAALPGELQKVGIGQGVGVFDHDKIEWTGGDIARACVPCHAEPWRR